MELIDVGGHRLAVTISGREGAPWIIMSNSLGTTMRMWGPQLTLLEPHRRVLRHDTRGHGASDTPPGPYDFDGLEKDVIALMDHFEIARADFIGLSLGGMIGLGLGLKHGDRMNRVVCCDARADAPLPYRQGWIDRAKTIDEGGMAALWPMTRDRWLSKRFQENEPDLLRDFEDDFMRTPPEGFKACGGALQTLDYLKDLGSMATPTLFVGGAEDSGAPPEVMQAMADATPEGRYIDIPGANHIANCDNPADFNVAIAEFLALA